MEPAPVVSVEFFSEGEADYTYFSATFLVRAGAAAFTYSTDALDAPDGEKLAAFRAALANGGDARLTLARRSNSKSKISLRWETALFEFDHEGSMEGGIGSATAIVPRATALGALSQFLAEWVRLFPPAAVADV